MSTPSDKCFKCSAQLKPMPLAVQIDMNLMYRELFPYSWRVDKPVRVCDPCFQKMYAAKLPGEWEIEAMLKDNEDV